MKFKRILYILIFTLPIIILVLSIIIVTKLIKNKRSVNENEKEKEKIVLINELDPNEKLDVENVNIELQLPNVHKPYVDKTERFIQEDGTNQPITEVVKETGATIFECGKRIATATGNFIIETKDTVIDKARGLYRKACNLFK
ncbi:hypothetical protein GVAV_001775 [Gurleya vavrai]